jgi:UDP-N-acetylmuramyl tripeptide synthase
VAAPRAPTSKRALFLAVVQMLKDGVVHLAAAGHEEYETLAKEFPRALDDKTAVSRAIMSKQRQPGHAANNMRA